MMFTKNQPRSRLYLVVVMCLLAILPGATANQKECCCCHNDGCDVDNCVNRDAFCCRRRLVSDGDATVVEKCANQQYKVSLVVEGHISIFAEPELAYMGCPSHRAPEKMLVTGEIT